MTLVPAERRDRGLRRIHPFMGYDYDPILVGAFAPWMMTSNFWLTPELRPDQNDDPFLDAKIESPTADADIDWPAVLGVMRAERPPGQGPVGRAVDLRSSLGQRSLDSIANWRTQGVMVSIGAPHLRGFKRPAQFYSLEDGRHRTWIARRLGIPVPASTGMRSGEWVTWAEALDSIWNELTWWQTCPPAFRELNEPYVADLRKAFFAGCVAAQDEDSVVLKIMLGDYALSRSTAP